ncbi:hypothetical protein JXR93_00200 [bacterium]|nr:hypothetical protein [bacterium]
MRIVLFILMTFISFSVFSGNTITILNFDNNSGLKKYNPLGKGLADMLTTDLTYVKGLTIVERDKLQELMNEIKLSKTAFIDKKTAVKLGKGVSAKWILKGSFITVKGNLRIDVNIIETESGKVVDSAYVEGNEASFFKMEKQLIKKIVKAIRTDETKIPDSFEKESESKELKNFDVVLNYSKGVELYDDGKFEEAEKEFKKTLEFDNNFSYSIEFLDKLEKRMAQYQKKADEIKNQEIKNLIDNYQTLKTDKMITMKISQLFGKLMSGMEYREMLKLIDFLKKDLPPSNEFLNMDELIQYYAFLSHYMLKNRENALKEGENFLKTFPSSIYFSSVKTNMEMLIESQKQEESLKNEYPSELEEKEKDFKENIDNIEKNRVQRYESIKKREEMYQNDISRREKKILEYSENVKKFKKELAEFEEKIKTETNEYKKKSIMTQIDNKKKYIERDSGYIKREEDAIKSKKTDIESLKKDYEDADKSAKEQKTFQEEAFDFSKCSIAVSKKMFKKAEWDCLNFLKKHHTSTFRESVFSFTFNIYTQSGDVKKATEFGDKYKAEFPKQETTINTLLRFMPK